MILIMISEIDKINIEDSTKAFRSLMKDFFQLVRDLNGTLERIDYFLHPEDLPLDNDLLFPESVQKYEDS